MSASHGAPPPATVPPHPRFFFSDGNVLLVVGGYLYCVHRSRVTSVCPVLAELLEQPDETLPSGWESRSLHANEDIYVHWTRRLMTLTRPSVWDNDGALILPDVPSRHLDAFLSVLYPINLVTYDLNTSEDWQAALSLATLWSCTPVIQLAIHHLSTYLEHDPAECLTLAHMHNIQDWIRPARRALCLRPQSFTADELRRLRLYPDDVAFIISTRERTRSGNARTVDSAIDAWESTAAAIPEPNAEEPASPPAPSHLSIHIPSPLAVASTVSHTTLLVVPELQAPIVTATGIPALQMITSGLAPETDVFTLDVPAEGQPASEAVDSGVLTPATDGQEGSVTEDVVTEIADTSSHSAASTTIRIASEVDDNGEVGTGGLLTLAGGQLAENVALSPIDDGFDGSAMQSRATSPHDEDAFDLARPTARHTTSVDDSPASSREDQLRSVGGSWSGEGYSAAWSARSSSEDPRMSGARRDDGITRAASLGSAATASPMKTFLKLVAATTVGLLSGSSNAESPRVRADSAPESGQRDKGKGRQTNPAVAIVGPLSAIDASASVWRPPHEPQASGASQERQGEADAADNGRDERVGLDDVEDEGDNEDEDEDDGDGGGEGEGEDNAFASTSQQHAQVADSSRGMSAQKKKKKKKKKKKQTG